MAWERFKELKRKCLHHKIKKWMLVHNSYHDFRGDTRTLIDATTRGPSMSKSANEAHDLVEEMAMNNYMWPNKRGSQKNVAGV